MDYNVKVSEWDEMCYKSPSEVHIELEEGDVVSKKSELKVAKKQLLKLTKDIPQIEKRGSKKICTKCHMAAGHTKAKCNGAECTDACQCGQLNRHPEQNKEVRKMEMTIQRLETEIKEKEEFLKMKKKQINEYNRSLETRVRTFLINSNKDRYPFTGHDGMPKVKNYICSGRHCHT